MAALEAAGGAGSARFVGGCVRNALLGKPVDDIDIATTLTPPEVISAVKGAGLKAVPTGIDHGTVTVVSGGKPFEVTTLRRDVETDGRRAVVAFTTDWVEDAQRRDFRLNALYADAAGVVFDPTGEGVADAAAGRIVFVGDAEQRILEDGLRILRFFRFCAWYGRGEPDADGLAACARLKDRLGQLSAERVSKELLKLLAADDPRPVVRVMAASGVLSAVLPQAQGLARFDSLVGIETEQLFQCDPLLRLAALLPDDSTVGLEVAEALRLSNAQRDRLVAALGREPRVVSWMSPREARRAVYRLGAQAFCDRTLLAWAASDRPAATIQWRALLPMAQTWPRPVFPLSGEEVMAAGVPKGPMIGLIMREVEDWWIDHDFTDDKLSMVEQLKAVAQGMAY
ncbi:CCA tRNA nucleotidyltransferase [Phenylobacterium montanum]|uniref:CCA tRNA nucleotidyltransferase n=1 Tax=Phenylobacterium montanum TaxID=2823693 RepID=A0A975G5C3_9CAUL|nr:CCA tRNA nucleotidyltransferase [Caulobacter sp. S6]QUD90862.1 CCA tRNA nucleotidyltransferase [Caulobacter sp. S6]